MKVVGIVQARMGSTRLPGKMMKEILGKPIIEYVFDRITPSQKMTEVWLATTTDPSDDVLVEWAENRGIKYYRGSVDDVLDRYYQTAKLAGADAIVRITGDCPLADYHVIDHVIQEFVSEYPTYVYVCNTQPPTFPDGLDTEVCAFAALEQAWHEAKMQSEREHVTPYIWKNPELFPRKNITNPVDLSGLRWTLDTAEDFALIRLIIEAMAAEPTYPDMERILGIFAEHPEWAGINAMHQRNEGYAKSLKEDKPINN